MKMINHKDGSVSFRFSQEERAHGYDGTDARAQALAQMANCTGGAQSMLADLLLANQKEFSTFLAHVGFGTEALKVMQLICMNAELSPFGTGCKDALIKNLLQRHEELEKKFADNTISKDEIQEHTMIEHLHYSGLLKEEE